MQFVIQTVPQPHVISDWIKSSIPLCTCKIVCQEGKCREMSHKGLIPSLWRCTATEQRGPMSAPSYGAWKCHIFVTHAVTATGRPSAHVKRAQSSPVPWQPVGVCVSPQRCCHLSLPAAPGPLARGTNEFNWFETSMKIISTHVGRNSGRFEYIHTFWVKTKSVLSKRVREVGYSAQGSTRQSEGVPNTNVSSECRERPVVLVANSLRKQKCLQRQPKKQNYYGHKNSYLPKMREILLRKH